MAFRIIELLLFAAVFAIGAMATITTRIYNSIARRFGFRIIASTGDEEEVITPIELFGILIKFLVIIGGLIAIYFIWAKFDVLYNLVFKEQLRLSVNLLTTPAFAAPENARVVLNNIIPIIFAGVLAMICGAFCVALASLLVLRDIKENKRRIAAADNIVKTFGGFLTGLLTFLLK